MPNITLGIQLVVAPVIASVCILTKDIRHKNPCPGSTSIRGEPDCHLVRVRQHWIWWVRVVPPSISWKQEGIDTLLYRNLHR